MSQTAGAPKHGDVYLGGEYEVDGKPFVKDDYKYVEVNGKLLPKSRELIFENGTCQILTADYDEKGHEIGSRNIVDGALESRREREYDERGNLKKSIVEFYDDLGKVEERGESVWSRDHLRRLIKKTIISRRQNDGNFIEKNYDEYKEYGYDTDHGLQCELAEAIPGDAKLRTTSLKEKFFY